MGDDSGFTRLEFFMYYTVFILFVVYLGGLAGVTIFSGTNGFENMDVVAKQVSSLNPIILISVPSFFFNMVVVNTEIRMLFIVVVAPFLVGLTWIILSWLRGV
jgi:hypothetical protein